MQKYTYNSGFTTNFEFLKQEKSPFTILYIHGLCSDPWGKKPEAVKNYASKHGIDFLRFELAGHGSDANNFAKTDMNIWKNQLFEIIDTMIKGPIVVIGSSIGGWLSLIAAKERPERIIGFVGIICPHIVKKRIGQDHRWAVPASAMTGSILLLLADTLSRSMGNGSALPVGAITSLLGAPFFLTIIFSRRGRTE